MGQVFTWDTIRSGKVPSLESFHIVSSNMIAGLSTEPSFVSVLLFGSVLRGDFNVRSDIDCAFLYEMKKEEAAMRVMHQIDKFARGLHVPINFTPCDTVLAGTRLHHLGTSFVKHLQTSVEAGGLVKGNLVELLAPTVSTNQEIESYITVKMYNMQESLAQMTSFSEERLVAFFKKALESSTHVARKMLIYRGKLEGDSKKQVRERYIETMPPELSELFDQLLRVDSWYSSELELQLRGLDESRYKEVLVELQSKLPLVIKFLRLNILNINNMTAR
ncbi:nucleotidyltransferase domain-containing protein [candidate division KSB1 bacterium]